jgi:hypothetical protein
MERHLLAPGRRFRKQGRTGKRLSRGDLASGTATNHAARVTDPRPELRRNGCVFESHEELRTFEALVRAQGELPTDATTSFFPLPLGRVGVGNTWTPDFVVVREGRAGLIEVDGPHHGGRRAADATPAAGAPRVPRDAGQAGSPGVQPHHPPDPRLETSPPRPHHAGQSTAVPNFLARGVCPGRNMSTLRTLAQLRVGSKRSQRDG